MEMSARKRVRVGRDWAVRGCRRAPTATAGKSVKFRGKWLALGAQTVDERYGPTSSLQQGKRMFDALLKEKLGPLSLRLALGSFCAYHGFLKIMCHGGGWWTTGMPTWMQLSMAWTEFGSGIAILLGFFCRANAGNMVSVTIGTLVWFHGWNTFHLPIKTLELPILLLLMELSVACIGAGDISIDARRGSSGRSSFGGGAAAKRKAA
jgi:uncharacterized membrane protein YphA (DoxX/SURF4 family)